VARLIQVIDTHDSRGTGVASDPHRSVRQFFDTDGTLLMEDDQWKREESAAVSRSAYLALHEAIEELHTMVANSPDFDNLRNHLLTAKRSLEGHR
jgi:hypothetical protein